MCILLQLCKAKIQEDGKDKIKGGNKDIRGYMGETECLFLKRKINVFKKNTCSRGTPLSGWYPGDHCCLLPSFASGCPYPNLTSPRPPQRELTEQTWSARSQGHLWGCWGRERQGSRAGSLPAPPHRAAPQAALTSELEQLWTQLRGSPVAAHRRSGLPGRAGTETPLSALGWGLLLACSLLGTDSKASWN